MKKIILLAVISLFCSACATNSYTFYSGSPENVNYALRNRNDVWLPIESGPEAVQFTKLEDGLREKYSVSEPPILHDFHTQKKGMFGWTDLEDIEYQITQYVAINFKQDSDRESHFFWDDNLVITALRNLPIGATIKLVKIILIPKNSKVQIGPATMTKEITPNELYFTCLKETKKHSSCYLIDKDNTRVKEIIYDIDVVGKKALLNQAKKEDALYWDKYRKRMRVAKKYCPSLIQQIEYMQYNPYAYTINMKKKIIDNYQKYSCAEYVSNVMNSGR